MKQFKSFLKGQKVRKETPEFDFINDVSRDKKFRHFKTWDELENYLIFSGGDKTVVRIAKRFFKRWRTEVSREAASKKPAKVDGLGPHDINKIKTALRKVWSWSHARKKVIARCTGKHGFQVCEQCGKKCPKIFVDHIEPVGRFDAGYIDRLFVPSDRMQGLCKQCHAIKTTLDVRSIKSQDDFY